MDLDINSIDTRLVKKAIEEGNLDLCKIIINSGFNFQSKRFDGLRYLAEKVSYPIDYGNQFNFTYQSEKYKNQLLILNLMLAEKYRNIEDIYGLSPLEIMISKGVIEFVEAMLVSGIIPNGNCFIEACYHRDFEIFKLLLVYEPNCRKEINRNYLHREHPTHMILSFDEDENQWHKYKSIDDVENYCSAHPRLYATIYKLILGEKVNNKNTSEKLKDHLDKYIIELEIFYSLLSNLYPPIDMESLNLKAKVAEDEFNKRMVEKINIVSTDLNFFNIKNSKEAFLYVNKKYDYMMEGENFNFRKLIANESLEKAMSEIIPLHIKTSLENSITLSQIAMDLKTTERKLKNYMNKKGLM
ncbi:hypothetical protein [Acinetobacter sp. Ac_5812]|uniref:hypothetical protein n=1 Tax=Acinetobacter sp. Ac_5812 TaxID=1848937 RepID=UPI00148FE82F|nr:hypothetical protein [Acinetobacter sp. Ac_5812]NNP70415.1 hypothetical protein [Acinetobacter sp. Ac_5812]